MFVFDQSAKIRNKHAMQQFGQAMYTTYICLDERI